MPILRKKNAMARRDVITIPSSGADLHILERSQGGWTIQQGGRHILVTRDEAKQLSDILADLTSRNYETVTPAQWVQH
ncbi:Uncharacterised protein [Mycobacteroides abscessus subsp. abscessus]|nr:Uncharacterised protein [Mycobacteroides abscessus subsp. abscessus]